MKARAALALTCAPRQAAALSEFQVADALDAVARRRWAPRLVDDEAGRLAICATPPRFRQRPTTEEAMRERMLVQFNTACLHTERLTEQPDHAFMSHPHPAVY